MSNGKPVVDTNRGKFPRFIRWKFDQDGLLLTDDERGCHLFKLEEQPGLGSEAEKMKQLLGAAPKLADALVLAIRTMLDYGPLGHPGPIEGRTVMMECLDAVVAAGIVL